MEEHRFCYPTVIPLEVGATAHGPRAASVRRSAAQVRSSAGEFLLPSAVAQLAAAERVRPSTGAQLRPSTVRSPWSRAQFRAAFGDHA
jgi:hypothetical protein